MSAQNGHLSVVERLLNAGAAAHRTRCALDNCYESRLPLPAPSASGEGPGRPKGTSPRPAAYCASTALPPSSAARGCPSRPSSASPRSLRALAVRRRRVRGWQRSCPLRPLRRGWRLHRRLQVALIFWRGSISLLIGVVELILLWHHCELLYPHEYNRKS